jgi:pentatricopeptide repeat protein
MQPGAESENSCKGNSERQTMVIPHIAALGALVGALARANDVDKALELYAQVCVHHALSK